MKLSVIVCTCNRAYAISGCLESIAQSIAAAAPVEAEIIVVDNASTDDTAAVIAAWAKTCPFPVQALHEPKKGVSAARNRALRAARGHLLAFTDDDCRLTTSYVADALCHDTASPALVLRGGRVNLGDPSDLPLTIKTDDELQQWSLDKRSARHQNLGNGFLGCNMTMRRALVEQIGPFDEVMGAGTALHGGEDTDYVFRVYLAGFALEYVPDMAVNHFHGRKTLEQGKKLLCGYNIGGGALVAKYIFRDIDLCRQFYWDLKDMWCEIRTGECLYLPQYDFSYRDKIRFQLAGMFKYPFLKIKSLF